MPRSRSRSRSRSRGRRRSRSVSRSRSRSSSMEDGHRVHVADLGIDCSKREIERSFEKFGPVLEVWLARNPPCFAFVVFRHREDAEEAIAEMNGKTLCGNRVRCSMALPRSRGRRSRRGYDPNLRCYTCGERGHFSRDCDNHRRIGGYGRRYYSSFGDQSFGDQRSPSPYRRRRFSRSRSRSPRRARRSRSRSPRRSRSPSNSRPKRSRRDSKRSRSRSLDRSRDKGQDSINQSNGRQLSMSRSRSKSP